MTNLRDRVFAIHIHRIKKHIENIYKDDDNENGD
jgi:hypothetical protein